jgi:hypothetical protein
MQPKPEILRQRLAFAVDCWRLVVSSSRLPETTSPWQNTCCGSPKSALSSAKTGGGCASTVVFMQRVKTTPRQACYCCGYGVRSALATNAGAFWFTGTPECLDGLDRRQLADPQQSDRQRQCDDRVRGEQVQQPDRGHGDATVCERADPFRSAQRASRPRGLTARLLDWRPNPPARGRKSYQKQKNQTKSLTSKTQSVHSIHAPRLQQPRPRRSGALQLPPLPLPRQPGS